MTSRYTPTNTSLRNVFTYGSLMFDPVWTRVVNGQYTSCPATLNGYQRFAVQGEEYPVAVPASPENSIPGVLYLDVIPQDLARLDDFEGEYYRRDTVSIILNAGEKVEAEVYILKPEYMHIAATTEWDVEKFRTSGIKAFIARYQGFTRN